MINDLQTFLVAFLYALRRDVDWDRAGQVSGFTWKEFLYALWVTSFGTGSNCWPMFYTNGFLYALRRDVAWDPTLPGGLVTSADETWLHRSPEDRPERAASTPSEQLSVPAEGLHRWRALTVITNNPLAESGAPDTHEDRQHSAHGAAELAAQDFPHGPATGPSAGIRHVAPGSPAAPATASRSGPRTGL